MRITLASITVTDLAAAAGYYRDDLGLPVESDGSEVRVTLGASTLVLTEGRVFAGEHHLALEIAPEDFETALAFARAHLAPISVDGSEVIEGPDGWDSRSVYWRGPEGIVLEYIAREAHRGRHPRAAVGGAPRVTALSEVGIGVDDVPAVVARLGDVFDVPPFPPQTPDFAPVGDHDGLLILVDPDRTWFPTRDATAARGPLAVSLAGHGGRPVDLLLSPTTTIRRS